ncbi:BAQ_1a_G0036190.mRNA.1.CDS.1 [Saccharomyces cerevisiae]|nr:BAQ_1a_G0036190.mRNA.1.CDS.1 [Saccharomyces cerevisiae]CAI4644980.1 BAM_G0036200.mRNA.1.CDS.1 [Saccharomyces cerevisiae]CAI7229448.1 BAM_G0036200.mRNA.1.CDS.1 [Saccharomyces cerevisiae]CAI7230426.1 BAQ_1a_G0036190.mRNA.1.CDS.1 [Saccharomyces cerevisiae]
MEHQQLQKYVELYNKEVEELYNGAASGRPAEFHPSKVHVKSIHEKASTANGGVEISSLGVDWDSEEKNTFFWCLSRYSIHRVDEWRSLLPRKSAMEILGYYRLLRRASASARSRKAGDDGAPIAYEMSAEWVALETKLSEAVMAITEGAAEVADEEGHCEGLIDYESWKRRWVAIYSHSRIAEIRPLPRHALPLSRSATQTLERCVSRYTRTLLWCTALAGMASRSVSARAAESRGHKSLPTVVTRRQVERALCTEARSRDLHVLPRRIALTLRKWELDYPREGKLFRTKEMAHLFLQSQLSRRDAPPVHQDENQENQENQEQDNTASEGESEAERDEIDEADLFRSALHENQLLKWLSK